MKDLSAIFGKFAGREVPAVETLHEFPGRLGPIKLRSVKLVDGNDPILKGMEDAAAANGLRLRVWWPDSVGTADWDPARVNVYIIKAIDGKWRVSPEFKLG